MKPDTLTVWGVGFFLILNDLLSNSSTSSIIWPIFGPSFVSLVVFHPLKKSDHGVQTHEGERLSDLRGGPNCNANLWR